MPSDTTTNTAANPPLRETLPGVYLLRFDFSSEKSSVLVPHPYQCSMFEIATFSVVGDEKLSVLLQRDLTSKTEIWVTNQIDGSKPVSWSKVLASDLSPDLQISSLGSFLLDEDKKVAVCCERWTDLEDETRTMDMDKIYVVGEDNKARKCVGKVLQWIQVGRLFSIMFQVWFKSSKLEAITEKELTQ